MYILEQVINGVCQGAIYALMAIGYSMIVGVTGLVTFTYGEVIMVGAFAAYYLFEFAGISVVAAICAGFITAGVLGIAIYKVCYEKFLDSPRHICLICTIGMSILVRNIAQICFGTESKGMPRVLPGYVELSGIRISYLQLLIIAVVILLSVILTLFFTKTRMGMRVRCVSQDRKAGALLGIDVEKTCLIGNSIGCAMGGVAGVLLSLYYSNVNPTMGGTSSLKAFSSAVLGGMDTIAGAAGGGMLIGICENLGIMVISSGLRDVIAFVFLIIVLLIKPQGLFGKAGGATNI